jgi:hypothetical protein
LKQYLKEFYFLKINIFYLFSIMFRVINSISTKFDLIFFSLFLNLDIVILDLCFFLKKLKLKLKLKPQRNMRHESNHHLDEKIKALAP